MPTGPRDRSYSAPPAQHNIAAQYAWSPDFVQTGSANPVTGNWLPAQADTSGFLKVVIVSGGSTTNVDVSGLNLTVGAVTLTGAPVVTLTGNTPVSIVNSSPIAISGIVQNVITGAVAATFPNPVGVTGTKVDAATIYATNPAAPYNFVSIGGRVVAPSGEGSVTGSYTTGQYAVVNFASNGGIFVNQGVLESGYDSVTASVQGGNSIPVNVTGIVLTQVTGTVSATFDSASIVLAQASGNAIAVQTNALLTGVSGLLSSNLTDAAWVTGNVGVQTSATISANTVSGLATQFFGTPLVANVARKAWGIQNIGTGLLLIKLASTLPTTGDLTFVLKGATNAWAGDGAIWTDSPAVYTGPVSVTGFGGAPCVYQAWEL